MRIRIIREPDADAVDGIPLARFKKGVQYEVGSNLATLFLAEGWAEPVGSDEPALIIPLHEFDPEVQMPANVTRELARPFYDSPPAIAHDRRRRTDRRRAR
jgi:hypothetical protein